MNRINVKKLVNEIRRLSEILKQHKRNIRQRHIIGTKENGWPVLPDKIEIDEVLCNIWTSQSMIPSYKHRVSVLLALRAHLRGMVHFHGSTLEEQETMLNKYKVFEPGSYYTKGLHNIVDKAA